MDEPQPLGSRYLLLEPLGRGASGEVWRAADREGAPYAVKVLHRSLTRHRGVVDRFVAERTVLTAVRGPHVVRVHDLVVEGDTVALVMDLVDGSDLRRALLERGPLTPSEVSAIGAQVALALGTAHDCGVVHRDVKPDNILLRERDGEGGRDGAVPDVVLTDFGVARLLSTAQVTGSMLGTPAYFAPETVQGSPAVAASDLYALGITLYELVCGHTPFGGRGETTATLRGHLEDIPGRPTGVPDPLWDAISALLSKEPGDRPTAGGLATYLDALTPRLRGIAAAPPSPGPPPPAGRVRPAAPPAAVVPARVSGPGAGPEAERGHPPGPGSVSASVGTVVPVVLQAPPPPQPASRGVVTAAAVVLAASTAFFAWVVLRDEGHPQTPTGAPVAVAEVTPSSSTSPSPAASRVADLPHPCPASAAGYAVGRSHRTETSCEFAGRAADAYAATADEAGAPATFEVTSPRGDRYTVRCAPQRELLECDYDDRQQPAARILLRPPA